MGEFAKIVLFCVLAALVFGVVHDQIAARICVEYFLHRDPPVFATTSPTLLGFGWGVLSSWWVGTVLGFGLACCARLGPTPPLRLSALLPAMVKVVVTIAVITVLAGVTGYMSAQAGKIWLHEPLKSKIPTSAHAAFIAVLFAHVGASASAFVGGTVVCTLTIQRRRRAA